MKKRYLYKRLLLIVLVGFFTLLTPSLINLKSYAEWGEGASCTAAGRPGTCWSRDRVSCGTYYDSGNYCPGDDSVQCCVHSQVACYPSGQPAGTCHNRYSGGFGNVYSCGVSWHPGYCPGPTDVQCCIDTPPPPTNVTAGCAASGTSVTVNWTRPSGWTYSYARIYDETTNAAAAYSGVLSGTSYSFNSATPGHRYSYWVHTTNSAGSPWSAAVPAVRSASVTCPIPACGDASSPGGSVLSTGVLTSASSVYLNNPGTYGPQNVVDGITDPTRFWEANAGAPQWIELNLGAPQDVSGLKLYYRQGPDGFTTHQVLAGANAAPTTNRRTLSCYTRNNQVVNVTFNPPLADTQYVRINTTSSPSWIGWSEVSVFGAAPGAQTDSPGIVYSGDSSAEFGVVGGRASVNDWVVGGLTYPEVVSTVTVPSTTAYAYMLDKITHADIPVINITTLAGCSSLANCSLPATIPSGVYQANGNLNLNAFAFPRGRNYIFLINGNLRINGNIVVPNGSTAFFSASNDIIVDRNVGTATNLYPLPSGQVQGMFSADRDFLVDGINSCTTAKDKMLNIEGSIVTNASGNGGHFRTQRDLCGDNPRLPFLTVRLRLDLILNAPVVLSRQNTILREEAP